MAKATTAPRHPPILYPVAFPSGIPLYHNSLTHLLDMAPQLGKLALELLNLGINKVFQSMGNVDLLNTVDTRPLVDNVSKVGDPSTVPCKNLV